MTIANYHLSQYRPVVGWFVTGRVHPTMEWIIPGYDVICPTCAAQHWDADALAADRIGGIHPVFAGTTPINRIGDIVTCPGCGDILAEVGSGTPRTRPTTTPTRCRH